jgi:hypothetical protein
MDTNNVNMPSTDDMNGPVTMAPTDYVTMAPSDGTMMPVTMAPVTMVPEIRSPEILPDLGPTNCQGFWNQTFADMGSMGHYPRPQGNLPMFSWGLTQDTQKELGSFYKQAFSGFK